MDSCDHSINRLNEEESIKFDKQFLKFCETGRWEMALSQFKKWMRKEFTKHQLTGVTTIEDQKQQMQVSWIAALRWVLEKAQEAQTNEKTMQDILEEVIDEAGDL